MKQRPMNDVAEKIYSAKISKAVLDTSRRFSEQGLSANDMMNALQLHMFYICRDKTSCKERAKDAFTKCASEEVFELYWENELSP